MIYKFQDELLQTAGSLIKLLEEEGVLAVVVEDSFRDYTAKVSVSRNGKSFGNVNLYYSPKRDLYSIRMHELKDESVIPALEKCWNRLLGNDEATHTAHQIYVDGSFLDGQVGYGVVILEDGKVTEELSGQVDAELVEGTRQIAGELFAVQEAIKWCRRNSVREVAIFYDCKGIEKWASGQWKTKHPLTQKYAEFVRNSGVRIYWHKVDSHTGDRWNERADELAKKAAGPLSSPETKDNSASELENEAKKFMQFLSDRGYDGELRGIYGNPGCAKIGITEGDKDLGYINIYRTNKIPFLPRYHELKDKSFEDKLDLLWREYHYGERQLPF